MKRRVIAAGLGLALTALVLTGCAGESLQTPEDVARAYMQAMEKGDMDRVLKLTSADSMDGLNGVETSPKAKSMISDLEIGEQTGNGEFTAVAVSYSLDGKPYRASLNLAAVSFEGKPSYRVVTVPPVLGAEEPLATVEIDGVPGRTIVPLGTHEVKRKLDNSYLAHPECTGLLSLTLGEDGAVTTGYLSGEECMQNDIADMRISEAATQEVIVALNDLAQECSEGCDQQTLQAAKENQLQTLPDGCGVEWLGTGEGYEADDTKLFVSEGGDYECYRYSLARDAQRGSAPRVDLFRIGDVGDGSKLQIRPSDRQADTLKVILPAEKCTLLCGSADRWSDGMTLHASYVKGNLQEVGLYPEYPL